ncbi:MAG: hypothetical protein PVH24_06085 [Candidatus Zixiibacteriota bacterium]|jgi:hypothetical protein
MKTKARYWPAVFAALLSILPASKLWADISPFELDFGVNALYESNIYHSFDNSSEVGSVVNVVEAGARWHLPGSRRFTQRLDAYAGFDLYPNYSNRNKNDIGVVYSPRYRYSAQGRFELEAGISRRNKDLIDDSGQELARTLKKWEADIELLHRYDFGPFRTEQSIAYTNHNYDERDTSVIIGADTTVVPFRSYDYYAYGGRLRVYYEPLRSLMLRFTYDYEKRAYDERKTYSIQYGAVAGRPFEIRKYTENKIEGRLEYDIINRNTIGIEVEYCDRNDSFENFYGYRHWQYRLFADWRWTRRLRTKMGFRFRNKDYDNYWTRNIGILNTVAIDYADFQVEQSYRITRSTTLIVFLQNYNKVSNDPSFDYHNMTIGTGFGFKY